MAQAQRYDQAAKLSRQEELATLAPTARAIRKFLDDLADKNQSELAALSAALQRGQWSGETKLAIAGHVKAGMQQAHKWIETSEKWNPQENHDHQDTLLVMKWLAGA